MNNIKIKVHKKVLKELCEKYDGAGEFINDRIEEICSHENLSAKEVIYFLVSFLTINVFSLAFLALNSFLI